MSPVLAVGPIAHGFAPSSPEEARVRNRFVTGMKLIIHVQCDSKRRIAQSWTAAKPADPASTHVGSVAPIWRHRILIQKCVSVRCCK